MELAYDGAEEILSFLVLVSLFRFMLDSTGYALLWALASRRFSGAVTCHSLFMIVFFEHCFE